MVSVKKREEEFIDVEITPYNSSTEEEESQMPTRAFGQEHMKDT